MAEQMRKLHEDSQRLLDVIAAAKFLGISERTLHRWRNEGSGPLFVRLGARRIAYRAGDLDAWTMSRTFASRAAELAQNAA